VSGRGAVVRRLTAADAPEFRRVRLEGFTASPDLFRIAAEEEAELSGEAVAARLEREHVVGGFVDGELQGIGGLTRFAGTRLDHRALLWGMYVRAEARGAGVGDAIVGALFDEARRIGVRSVLLTVIAGNERAERLYRRWGFERYGVEPGAVRTGSGYVDEALMIRRLAASGGD
jgi:GNAT superfamily N-acetyltransferase